MKKIRDLREPSLPSRPKPPWIRSRAPSAETYDPMAALLRSLSLHSVCEEARCPNLGECWSKKQATFMILGSICTRACAFCNVTTGRPMAVDGQEPARLAQAVAALSLSHVVITSVDRDDLDDGGAAHFADCIRAVRAASPSSSIEVLTPDFLHKEGALETIMDAAPDVFNHNLETVPRLYRTIRPAARYYHSLRLLDRAREILPGVFTKSGIMVGLGETFDEVVAVMDDLLSARVDFITIGQYLRPTPRHAEVAEYVLPDVFERYAALARAKGFKMVSSSPLTRSSHHAAEDFSRLRAKSA